MNQLLKFKTNRYDREMGTKGYDQKLATFIDNLIIVSLLLKFYKPKRNLTRAPVLNSLIYIKDLRNACGVPISRTSV